MADRQMPLTSNQKVCPDWPEIVMVNDPFPAALKLPMAIDPAKFRANGTETELKVPAGHATVKLPPALVTVQGAVTRYWAAPSLT